MKASKSIPLTGNREAWLRTAYDRLRAELIPEAPKRVALTWGFPSRRAMSAKKRVMGQCFDKQKEVEGKRFITVSPIIIDSLELLATLAHEMIHGAVGCEAGHRKAFSQMAKRVGFKSPWTQTPMTDELKVKLRVMLKVLPPWPGGHVVPAPPKEKGRQLKAVCNCKRILRISRKTYADGAIICGLCKSEFELIEQQDV